MSNTAVEFDVKDFCEQLVTGGDTEKSVPETDDTENLTLMRTDTMELLKAKYVPLWYHKQGLMQTASGYGKNQKTAYKVFMNNRWYRVKSDVISNNNPLYIVSNGERIYLS